MLSSCWPFLSIKCKTTGSLNFNIIHYQLVNEQIKGLYISCLSLSINRIMSHLKCIHKHLRYLSWEVCTPVTQHWQALDKSSFMHYEMQQSSINTSYIGLQLLCVSTITLTCKIIRINMLSNLLAANISPFSLQQVCWVSAQMSFH